MITTAFTFNTAGWTVSNGTRGYAPNGGNPGGAITAHEGGSGTYQYQAPESYLGDKGFYYGGTLSFDLRQADTGAPFEDADVLLFGDGRTLAIDAGPNPGVDWTSYSVDLELGAGWKIGSLTGRVATEAEIRATLADLTGISIRGEFYTGGTETTDASALDNVTLAEGFVSRGPEGTDAFLSTFDRGTQGWGFTADVSEFGQIPSGGNPGGYLEAVDGVGGQTWYFTAPESYLGDKSAFSHGELRYDIRQSATTGQFDAADVILRGTGGALISAFLDAPPGTDWSTRTVTFDTETPWRTTAGLSGPLATQAQIDAILADLTALQIRGEFISGADRGGLDNVLMATAQGGLGVELFDGFPFDTLLSVHGTIGDALAAALDGDGIRVRSADALPPGTVFLDLEDLTIESSIGVATAYALDPGLVRLALEGTDNTVGFGNAEENILTGSAGNNQLNGFAGADLLRGGQGRDLLFGGQGRDLLEGNRGADTLEGGRGADSLGGGLGGDLVSGGAGDDLLVGGLGEDDLFGNEGADRIFGNQGADLLFGGRGADILLGGAGEDTLVPGRGIDLVDGGEGADLYLFGEVFGQTTLVFEAGLDRIDLSEATGEAADFDAFLAGVTQAIDGVVVYDQDADGLNVLVLTGVSLAELVGSDFLF